ncbi:hypothetical protein EDC01DRAFT_181254 [Geopyxis carbonaria]|nr:hypothetical protein EDC01DRAFT_181254 [Geopyxis carbonaria]
MYSKLILFYLPYLIQTTIGHIHIHRSKPGSLIINCMERWYPLFFFSSDVMCSNTTFLLFLRMRLLRNSYTKSHRFPFLQTDAFT